MKKIINLPTLLFIILVGSILWPSLINKSAPWAFLTLVVALYVIFQFGIHRDKDPRARIDSASILFIVLLIWEILATKLNFRNQVLVPTPEEVFNVFIDSRLLMWKGFARSMSLLLAGFSLALGLGITGGLMVGWNPRLRQVFFPLTKALSTVPALVYIPYVVAIMPTFASASIFVVFCGIFFSTFMNQINYVVSIDQRLIDSAKVLNLKTSTMLFKVVLPFTLPRNIDLLAVSLSISFMTLTAAEMIGANAGLGYFVRKFCDYADYARVIAGIIFIGIIVSFLNLGIDLLRKKVVKWHY